ncbi:MAG: peptidase domain-containing ABC transporter [Bacteroidales bacterium]|nr:peptidase domain-containing ABC transporter [Bacteroidales bacterium]
MNKQIKKSFTLQHDQADCGVACLLSVLKFYNSDCSLEQLRELSGTNKQGTSLLGLYQAAQQLGFKAKGVESDIKNTLNLNAPVILHVQIDKLEHYIVLYGQKNGKLIIGNPAKGLEYVSTEYLHSIWKTKYCLVLEPTSKLIAKEKSVKEKKRWLLSILKKDNNIIVSSIAIGVVIALLSMTIAVVTQKLVDNILPSKNTQTLIYLVLFLFFLLSIKILLSYIRSIFLIKQNRNFNNRITHKFYSTLLSLPKRFFDTRAIGDMVARLNDTSRIQSFISQLIGRIIIDALMLVVSLCFLFYYSFFFGVTSLIFLSVYYVIIFLQTKKIIDKQHKIMVTYAQVEANYINTIGGISEIKNYSKQREFNTQNAKVYNQYQENIYGLGLFQTKLNVFNGFLSTTFQLWIFGFGAYLVMTESLSLGIFMAIFAIATSLLPYVTSLAMTIVPLNEAKIAFNRMYEFVSHKYKLSCSVDVDQIIDIDVQNISFRFAGRKQLLKNASFNVKQGEIISIIGENGCGKSTIAQILNRFYSIESGNILINKTISLADVDPEKWRKKAILVSQHTHIFNGSIIENIAMKFGNYDFEDTIRFIHENGFAEYFKTLPLGIYTVVGEVGLNLSGGQKQLIAIARALLKKPQLLILDETTSAMDTNTENFVLTILKKIQKEMAIIFVTHRLHILHSLTNKIYIIDNGETKKFGSHAELLNSDNFYNDFWRKLEKSPA